MEDVVNHPLIEVFTNAGVKRIDGYVGQFTTVLESMGRERELSHGVVVLATGARERKPREYLYGDHGSVLTQMELEELLQRGGEQLKGKKNIVMIQCVGSRDEERPYCSRVCCNQAIKNALALKEMDPDRNITILYRDIRAYGLHETDYRRARRAGIQFIRYEPDRKPVVRELDGRLRVEVYDDILDASLSVTPDLLVLSAAIEPPLDENKRIAQMLKVPLNQDGFFLEAHAKLQPVDFATDGVFLCGLAHAPKNLQESIAQGRGSSRQGGDRDFKGFPGDGRGHCPGFGAGLHGLWNLRKGMCL
ncbi:MAG: hypothetical protein ACOX6S_14290 [Clostridia bacterium]